MFMSVVCQTQHWVLFYLFIFVVVVVALLNIYALQKGTKGQNLKQLNSPPKAHTLQIKKDPKK